MSADPRPDRRTLLARARARLEAAGVPEPAREARRLLAWASGRDGALLDLAAPPGSQEAARFETALARRAARVPFSQIAGIRAFWKHDFRVTADVLDPRPETETLVAAALERPAARLLDLGTGSGCILLSLLAEWPEATGLGLDASPPALAVAADNARRLGLAPRAGFRRSDWCAALAPGDGPFDLIVANPPYVSAAEWETLAPEVRLHEPRAALIPGTTGGAAGGTTDGTAGGDGLDAYRRIAAEAPARLAAGGRLMVEIGPTQAEAVAALFAAAGLGPARVLADLDARPRVVAVAVAAAADAATTAPGGEESTPRDRIDG